MLVNTRGPPGKQKMLEIFKNLECTVSINSHFNSFKGIWE
jgi:hypothetical protein